MSLTRFVEQTVSWLSGRKCRCVVHFILDGPFAKEADSYA